MQNILNLRHNLKGKDLRSLSIDTLWTVGSQIFITLLNIGTVYFLANLLSLNNYGEYKLVTTWLAIAISFGYTGYTYTIPQKFAKKEFVDLHDLFRKTFLKSIHVLIGLLFICIYYFINRNFDLGISFFLAAVLAPITLISNLSTMYFVGIKDFKLSAITQNLVDILQFASIVIVAYLTSNFLFTISAFLISTILGNILLIMYTLIKSKEYFALNTINEEESKAEEAGANKLNISSIFSGFSYQLDKLLIFHFIGATELAAYSIVLAISDQSRTPFKAIAGVLLPRFSKNNSSPRKIIFLFLLMTFLSLCLSVLVVLLNPIIFQYVFPKYLNYVYLANICAFTIVFGPTALLVSFLQSKKDFDSLNTQTNLLTFLQVTFYIIAAITMSLTVFIVLRLLIMLICSSYLFYKVARHAR